MGVLEGLGLGNMLGSPWGASFPSGENRNWQALNLQSNYQLYREQVSSALEQSLRCTHIDCPICKKEAQEREELKRKTEEEKRKKARAYKHRCEKYLKNFRRGK